MDNKVFTYCAIAAVLGIIAAATGFAAEATKVKASEVNIVLDTTCVYPSSPALALGILSVVFTIITRIYIGVFFGGSGCCRIDPNSSTVSKLLFFFSWLASAAAVVILISAAGLSYRQGLQSGSHAWLYYMLCSQTWNLCSRSYFSSSVCVSWDRCFSYLSSTTTTHHKSGNRLPNGI